MLLEDLIDVAGIDARDGALSTELEGNTVGLLSWVTVGDVNTKRAIVELGALGTEGHLDNS